MRMKLMILMVCLPLFAQDDTDTALRRGVGELSIAGGVAMHWSPWESYNALRLGYAAGLTRNVALIGGYSLHHYASESACVFGFGCATGKARGHEYTVGGRVSFPLRGVTPYGLGVLGGLRQAYRVDAGSASAVRDGLTFFVVGGGAGMDVRVNRYFGLQVETRAMKSPRHSVWYIAPAVGIYLRHR